MRNGVYLAARPWCVTGTMGGPRIVVQDFSSRESLGLPLDNEMEDTSCDETGCEYDGSRWDLEQRNIDSTVSLSQFSIASTTNTGDLSSSFVERDELGRRHSLGRGCTPLMSPDTEGRHQETVESHRSSKYGTAINEQHANYVLMYEMLTGIRIAVAPR